MTRLAIMAALVLSGCGEARVERPDGGEQWNRWARAVEARFPLADGQGHGPDVGSEEWSRALQQKLGIVDAQGHGPDIGSAEWRSAVEEKLP
jgi:hypothetical protein